MTVERIVRLAALTLALLCSGGAWAGPVIESWETANGARVLFVGARELPMVDVRVVFDAGAARDGGRPGLATLTNATLSDGAGAWDADRLAERLDAVGAELGLGARRDMAWVSMRSLSEAQPFEVAMESLTAVLARPRFAAADLERNRKAMLIALRQSEQNPGAIAKKAFWGAVYGAHPYARDGAGERDSLAAITRDEVLAFHRRFYVARNAVVAIVGDLERGAAEALAERLTRDLPEGGPAPALPGVVALERSDQRHRQFPSTQSHIYMGQPGMHRGDPDYFTLYVGNHIFGGSGLVSLLSNEVREQRGLSYSVYSYFAPMREDGPFIMAAQTQNAKAGEARRVMRAALAAYIENGPTEEQLREAKQNITGGFPLNIASNGKIVEYLAMIGFYGLPLDYLDTFTGRIEAVTREQIREAFRRRVRPERFVTVVVGDGAAAD
ncbi:MAG: insulinase family protein [gamma proteobacterium symbiont of Phacoides pectinatus]